MKWSLNELYNSFESEKYEKDFKNLKDNIKKFQIWSEEELNSKKDNIEKIEEYLYYQKKVSNLLIKLVVYSNLNLATDANNNKAMEEFEKLMNLSTALTAPEVRFQNFLGDIDNLEELFEKSEEIKEHKFILKEIKENSKYMLSEGEEIVFSKMQNTGSNAWSNLQDQLSSTLLVDIEIDGKKKELPLSTIRNFAFSSDKELRKKAYFAELESYKKIEKSSAAALNGIKGEVLTNCELRGYKSPLDMTLKDSRMNKKTLNSMLKAMEESFPKFRKYFQAKAKYLGHKEGLPFYDLFAPVGTLNKEYTYEEAGNYIVENFNNFSEELGGFAKKAIDNNWIDVLPKEGKRGGAFCSNIHPIGESRFLLNFDGSFSSLLTMAHELGHGYHGAQLIDESLLNSSYPMPLAETASIFCETIILNSALNEASEEEELSILEAAISSYAQVIVDISSRYLFESEFFERRKTASLSVEEMKEIMVDSQLKTYGDGLDREYLHPYMWICKTHYYSASRNFYNFPYAFGLLFAKGLYAIYLQDKENFMKSYNNLLKATGKNTIEDVAKMMDIDIEKEEFFREALELISKDIDRYIELVEKLN